MKTSSSTLIVTIVTAMATALCGCPLPQQANLVCQMMTFDESTGVMIPGNYVSQLTFTPAPKGVYARLTEQRVTRGSVEFLLGDGSRHTMPLSTIDEKSDDEKCFECVPPALAGAVVVAGLIIPTIIFLNDKEVDVVIPVGSYVVNYTLTVELAGGQKWLTTFGGPLDGSTPPNEGASTLNVKVQGQGKVYVKEADEYVDSSATYDVNLGAEVHFIAIPQDGNHLVGWKVNGQDGVNTLEAMVTIESDVVDVTAIFAQDGAPEDTTPPVITLNGSNPTSLTIGTVWNDPGASAVDAVDGICAVAITGTVNTNVVGTYAITYTAAD